MRSLAMALVVGALGSVALAQETNMIGRWPFDEGTGTNTVDATGNGYDGTLTGNPLPVWTGGVIAPVGGQGSHALGFDGAQNEVVVPDAVTLSPSNALTICAWVKAATNLTSEAVAKWSTTTNAGSYLLSLTNGWPMLELMLGGTYTSVVGQIASLSSTNWHHLAGTYDGTALRVYLDGVLAGWSAATGTVDVVSDPLRIGLMAGQLDDVRLYDTALTTNELAALYNTDADGDGFPDYREANAGTNPNDPNSYPSGISSGAVSQVLSPPPAPLTQQGSMTCVTVPATPGGVSWGCVAAGQTYEYTASGTICWQAPGCPIPTGPDGAGFGSGNSNFKCPGLERYSLVGQIDGGDCIQLGSSGSFTASASGTLTLYFNDDIWDDNSGSWECCITRPPVSLTLVDAQGFRPQWQAGSAPTLQTPITDSVNGYDCAGALTDGASLIVVQLSTGVCSLAGWTVTVSDPADANKGAAQVGSLHRGSNTALPALPATVAEPGNTSVTLQDGDAAIFYRPPVIWAFARTEKTHAIQFEVKDSGGNTVTNQTFTLHKPPLVLVHGILSSQSTWDTLVSALGSQLDFVRPDCSGTSTIPAMQGQDLFYLNIALEIVDNLTQLRNSGVAATRFDYLGHSNGGVAGHWWMKPDGGGVWRRPPLGIFQKHPWIAPVEPSLKFRQAQNFGLGFVREFITIGSPHIGTLWANQAVNMLQFNSRQDSNLYWLYKRLGKPNVDIASDLAVNSSVTGTINAEPRAPVRSKYLGGRATVDFWDGWPITLSDLGLELANYLTLPLLAVDTSDRIVPLASQGNGQDPVVIFPVYSHIHETDTLALQSIVSDLVHSPDLSEFAPDTGGWGY